VGWQKGQSGNPQGRKRNTPALAEELRKQLGHRRAGPGTPTTKSLLVTAAIDAALAGDAACLRLIFERVDGPLIAEMLPPSLVVNVGIQWPWDSTRDDSTAPPLALPAPPSLPAGRRDE
jgi:hypothetical protein